LRRGERPFETGAERGGLVACLSPEPAQRAFGLAHPAVRFLELGGETVALRPHLVQLGPYLRQLGARLGQLGRGGPAIPVAERADVE